MPPRWLLLVPLILLACGQLPEGIGSNHEVLVLADDAQWQRFEGILEEIFQRKVFTAQEEYIFTLKRGKSEEFKFYQKWKNLVLLATFDHQGPTVDLMGQLLSPEAKEKISQGEAFFFARQDVWAREQQVFFFAAQEEEILTEKLRENRERIFELMENALNVKVSNMLYANDEQVELEKRLFREYGWTVRIPWGYRVEREFPGERFVWLRKQQPQRWIFVSWEDTEEVSVMPEWCLDERDRIGREFYDGDEIVRGHTTFQQVNFADHRAVRLSGLWENKSLFVGGPFRTFCFYDEGVGRRYLVDVAVFAAGVEKEPYLRQLDVIAHTFSTEPLEGWK